MDWVHKEIDHLKDVRWSLHSYSTAPLAQKNGHWGELGSILDNIFYFITLRVLPKQLSCAGIGFEACQFLSAESEDFFVDCVLQRSLFHLCQSCGFRVEKLMWHTFKNAYAIRLCGYISSQYETIMI